MILGVMCPSPSRASVLHVTMTKKYRIWRNIDLLQRQGIWTKLFSLFRVEHIQIWACKDVQRRSLCTHDDYEVPEWGVPRRLKVFLDALLRAVLSSQYVTPSTPRRIHWKLERVIQVYERRQSYRPQVQCCPSPHCPPTGIVFHISNEHTGRGSVFRPSLFTALSVHAVVFLVQDRTPHPLLGPSGRCTLLL